MSFFKKLLLLLLAFQISGIQSSLASNEIILPEISNFTGPVPKSKIGPIFYMSHGESGESTVNRHLGNPDFKTFAEKGKDFKNFYLSKLQETFDPQGFSFVLSPEGETLKMLRQDLPSELANSRVAYTDQKARMAALVDTHDFYSFTQGLTVTEIDKRSASNGNFLTALEFFRKRYYQYLNSERRSQTPKATSPKDFKAKLEKQILKWREENFKNALSSSESFVFQTGEGLKISSKDLLNAKLIWTEPSPGAIQSGGRTHNTFLERIYKKWATTGVKKDFGLAKEFYVVEPKEPLRLRYKISAVYSSITGYSLSEKSFVQILEQSGPSLENVKDLNLWHTRWQIEAARRDVLLADFITFLREEHDASLEALSIRVKERLEVIKRADSSSSLTEELRRWNVENEPATNINHIRWAGYSVHPDYWKLRDQIVTEASIFKPKKIEKKAKKFDAIRSQDPKTRFKKKLARVAFWTMLALAIGAPLIIKDVNRAYAQALGPTVKTVGNIISNITENLPGTGPKIPLNYSGTDDKKNPERPSNQTDKKSQPEPQPTDVVGGPETGTVDLESELKEHQIVPKSEMEANRNNEQFVFSGSPPVGFFGILTARNLPKDEALPPVAIQTNSGSIRFDISRLRPMKPLGDKLPVPTVEGYTPILMRVWEVGAGKLSFTLPLYVIPQNGLTFGKLPVTRDPDVSYQYEVSFVKSENQKQKVADFMNLDPTILKNINSKLAAAGGTRLAGELDAGLAFLNPDIYSVAAGFAFSGFYTYSEAKAFGPPNPQNPFDEFRQYLENGSYYYQCSGSNQLLVSYLSDYFSSQKDVLVEPVSGFLFKGGLKLTGKDYHLQTLVTKPSKPFTYAYLDATPFAQDPRNDIEKEEKKPAEEKKEERAPEKKSVSPSVPVAPARAPVKTQIPMGGKLRKLKMETDGSGSLNDKPSEEETKLGLLESAKNGLFKAVKDRQAYYQSLKNFENLSKLDGLRFLAYSKIISDSVRNEITDRQALILLVAIKGNVSRQQAMKEPFSSILGKEADDLFAKHGSFTESVKFLVLEEINQVKAKYEVETRSKNPAFETKDGYIRDAEIAHHIEYLGSILRGQSWEKPAPSCAKNLSDLAK